MSAITIMNEDEIQRTESISGEPGFGCLETSLGNLPVKALDVKTKINGLVYETVVRQTYINRYDQPLEATYVFPLPDRAAVGEFKMIVAGRVIDGVLKERGEARREYQQAIEQGHRASIVEEERPDTFTMRVGNIEPGEEATIEFKLTGPLVFADGEATFRFPLVVAPRYIPGKPLEGGNVGDGVATDTEAVPDASRISPPVLLPGFPNPIQLAIEVELDEANLRIDNVRSSLHAVTVDNADGERHIRIQPGERVNRDFILRFDVAEESVQSSMTYRRDAEGDEGTFMVTLVPPTDAEGAELPRDIVFVLDRSGSMNGWKMVAARRALGRMLDTLTPNDRFQVIAFDNYVQQFGDDLIEGTNRNRYTAIEKLAKIDARGGTEMAQPIFGALDMLTGGYADRRRMVVLVTDGQVGNEQQIIAGVQKRMKNVRIFTVGIDQAVNAGFLNRLADIGGGRCELVESEHRLDDAMDRIHRTIDTPVLTELSVSLDGVDYVSSSMVPSREPDLFAGAPVRIFGRFRGAGTPVATLRAAHRDASKWEKSLPGRETGDDAVTALWARQRVRAMEDDYASRGRDPSLSKRITELSLRFGVLCRFTSWVAVDREAKIETSGDVRQVVQPVESPAGWGLQQKGAAPMSRSMAAPPPAASFAPQQAYSSAAPLPTSAGMGASPPGAIPMEASEVGGPRGGAAEGDAFERIQPDHAQHSSRERRRSSKTPTRATQARPGHRAPEQLRGDAVGLHTDVFLLGLIAFEMLAGRPLFSSDAEVANWSPADLGRESAIHGDWFDVLQKALAPDSADRYDDARDLLDDLERRFGRDSVYGGSDGPSTWEGTRPLSEVKSLMTPEGALVVLGWLTSHVAREQERTGAPVLSIRPEDILVDGEGRAHLRDLNGPGFFDKLKRWLGLADDSPRRDDEFWK